MMMPQRAIIIANDDITPVIAALSDDEMKVKRFI